MFVLSESGSSSLSVFSTRLTKGREMRIWGLAAVVCTLLVTSQGGEYSSYQAREPEGRGCKLPDSWAGRWFQLGAERAIIINSTHVDTKGECIDSIDDKYFFHDRADDCYRCIGMYSRHANVIEYKETYCLQERSMELRCNEINGDALLQSMFRLDGTPVPCPFKNPPFSFNYSRGMGECSHPPSRADACTVDTRLVLRYQACHDVEASEAAVEELECLATWKESSTLYLMGKLHHKNAKTDEQRYRCFVYKALKKHQYEIAQSAEASCSGVYSSNEGSVTIKLTKVDTPQPHCKFPGWVTQHYHWHSLDYHHNYHFSHRNASLRVSAGSSGEIEAKLSCHTLVQDTHNMAKLIIHVVSGCDGGYKCMTFYKRDPHVLQMYQSAMTSEPSEACSPANDNPKLNPTDIITLITQLPTKKCPLDGKYAPLLTKQTGLTTVDDCSLSKQQPNLQALFVGCSPSKDIMEFQMACRNVPLTAFSCHGSWTDNTTTYVIGSPVNRHSTDARHYCFIFSQAPTGMILKRVAETCALNMKAADWSFNITETGKCSENGATSLNTGLLAPLIGLTLVAGLCNILR